ncbi:hypothetical protein [Mucilaginibacter paludis]|uniref:Uncharacterized protein n=1 Tax=Mucilaginibacter paludis DSM 18603 TaxID=714943 RepID=H1YHF6_9SPHI|nr:hypothetical protein [Mucilaginibacter paludis]EHQ25490.1 hypothetical protein Mucpa_1328 [Mucilaginibacter paludis DSM 18603]
MKLLRKRQTAVSPKQEELAAGIAGTIIGLQTKAADYLNEKASHLSGKARLFMLILFCVVFTAINLYLLIHSI